MALISGEQTAKIRCMLERDRAWSAYALADLDQGMIEDTSWLLGEQAVIMTYSGIQPPVLFTFGDPHEIAGLADSLPHIRYQISMMQPHLEALQPALQLEHLVPMERMLLDPSRFPAPDRDSVQPLSRQHLKDIYTLFSDHTDQPDAFVPQQLDQGTFFGIYQDGKLVSFGGTHVLSPTAGVAAVGSIFTHPEHRGKGFASQTTWAVVHKLRQMEIRTVVLNVSPTNESAVRCYRGLGFDAVYSYYEGTGTIS